MNWVLIALATNSFMGSYATEADCQGAIRDRILADMMPPAILRQMDEETKKQVRSLALGITGIQTEYICTKRG